MIDDFKDHDRQIGPKITARARDALEGTIEVPMSKPMRIACDDRRFITMYVISMIAVTARIVALVLAFVVVGFTRGIVVMDVRMVSSTMPMMEDAHYIDPIRGN